MNNIKDIRNIIILILVGYIVFLQQCNTHKCNKIENTITKQLTETKVDTIPFYYPVPSTIKPEIPKPIIVYLPSDSDKSNPINSYTKEFEDSLIKGNLYSKVNGNELIDWSFDYIPKFPKYIKEVTTITNNIEQKKRNLLFLNSSLGFNKENFYTNIGVSLYQKKGYLYGYMYDPINKVHTASIGIQLNNR